MLVKASEFIQHLEEFDIDREALQEIFIEYNSTNKLLPLRPFTTYVHFDEEEEKVCFSRISKDIVSTEHFTQIHTGYEEIQALLFH